MIENKKCSANSFSQDPIRQTPVVTYLRLNTHLLTCVCMCFIDKLNNNLKYQFSYNI